MEQKKEVKTPSQAELMKVEIAEKNRQIEILKSKVEALGNELKREMAKSVQAAEIAKEPLELDAASDETVTVKCSGLKLLFMMMWARKLQQLDRRSVYRWYTELTGCDFETAAAQIRTWVGGGL